MSFPIGNKGEKLNKLHQGGFRVTLRAVYTTARRVINAVAAVSNLQNKGGVIHVSTAITPPALSLAVY